MDGSGAERRRLGIDKVGEVATNERGGVHYTGWRFRVTFIPPGEEFSVEPTDEGMGGWVHGELHLIAHGDGCACPVIKWLEDH